MSIADIRTDYRRHAFSEQDAADDPIAQFTTWFDEAVRAEVMEPNAMCLATATPDAYPSARMVLLKGVDARGFVFYTNLESRKGTELSANPHAALCFHWKSLHRSVRVEGAVEPVSAEEADSYYASRARTSRLGAWASKQSRPLESRFALEKAVAEYGMKYAIGEIPRPPHWSGFRVTPVEIEFWVSRPFRLHDRVVFRREDAGAPWQKTRLFP